jgi:hypothetical protein
MAAEIVTGRLVPQVSKAGTIEPESLAMSDVLDPLKERLQSTVCRLDGLAARVRSGVADVADFRHAQEAFTWLLLSTGEFALAVKRLENARDYLLAGEPGAAGYELRLLINSLQFGKPA